MRKSRRPVDENQLGLFEAAPPVPAKPVDVPVFPVAPVKRETPLLHTYEMQLEVLNPFGSSLPNVAEQPEPSPLSPRGERDRVRGPSVPENLDAPVSRAVEPTKALRAPAVLSIVRSEPSPVVAPPSAQTPHPVPLPARGEGTLDGSLAEKLSESILRAAPRPPQAAEGALGDALRLDQNLALMAGAGTGKTHSLITLCLHLLSGARQNPTPIPPSALGLLTFTDKAAAEMRQRLYARVDALVRDPSAPDEPQLRASFEAFDRELPPSSHWRTVRDGLGSAPIGTFHALCVQLLREAPVGRAFSPSFELLDDRTARELITDTADRVVLAALEKNDPHAVSLVREWQLAGDWGVSGHLAHVLSRVREEGQTPENLPIGDEASARTAFARQLEQCFAVLAQTEAEAARAVKPENRDRCAAVRRALTGLTYENANERLALIGKALAGARLPELRQSLLPGRSTASLANLAAGIRAVPYERAFRALLTELYTQHQTALRRRNALDFTALLTEARDLLRDDLHARQLAQGRFQALLVDELQDTNRLQLELLHLLGEKREGGPRRTNPPLIGSEHSVTALPLEPAFLCVVGDRKQSIYEFRGADVSVVEAAAQAIDASGGTRAFLKQSRRSSPALVSFFNAVLPSLMSDPRTQRLAPMVPDDGILPAAPPARSFEVSYIPAHDDLSAFRDDALEGPAVERYTGPPSKATADDLRYFDSRALARRVRELIESGVAGGKIAFLFRRFSFVEEYRQALLAEGIPHRVVRGRGFYAAQEVMDLSALLALVADAADATALAVVARSPLVGLTDASLLRLSRATGERLDARAALALAELPAGFSAVEKHRFGQLQTLVRRLRAERHRLSVRSMLREALTVTGYLEAMAATTFGPQVLANVEKLLELAARRDEQGPADCGAFARELAELTDVDPLESQAEVIDEDDPAAVTLCTIHQAKGLEWPVVVLPELFSPTANFAKRARYERDLGLVVRLGDGAFENADSPRFERAKAERKAREDADFKRVRYVAMTRARDRLIFGVTKKGAAWADLDVAMLGIPGVLERPLQLPEPKPAMVRSEGAPDLAALERARVRLEQRPAPVPKSALLPVTQLQDFATCPTRYRLLHLVGLSEWPAEPRDVDVEAAAPVADVRERGTHAHKLLEVAALGAPNDLAALERAHGLPEDLEVRGWVERFLGTGFARGLRDVHRELPFMLRLEHEGFTLHLRGAIDLLTLDPDGGATVVDYKSSLRPDAGLEAYRFQLGCYVLAARALLGDVPIRAGISFLREADPTPELLPPGVAVDEAWLAAQARALVTAQVDGRWQGLPEARCRAVKCGYVYRCHPAGGRV